MPVQLELNKANVPVKVFTKDVDPKALDQLSNVASLPIVHHHVAAMPDVHLGIGATVGSVIPTRGAVIPAAVGVDIGCGMNAVRLAADASALPDTLRRVRTAIERAIPVGFSRHEERVVSASVARGLEVRLDPLLERNPGLGKMLKDFYLTWNRQLGTLGGGNHFIEICLDESDQVWVMLHSGSRGVGNAIGRYFIARARKDMEAHLGNLPDKDLAYLKEGSASFDDYVEAVEWAQDYAAMNRKVMMERILNVLKAFLPTVEVADVAINCHHNYVTREEHFGERVYVTRKGAIRAGAGDLGIIPGSMGARSYIVRGLGNADAFDSCAHGAGRRMSRTEAKRQFSVADLSAQTEGVECRVDKGVVDEVPLAYKDIDEVMENQRDLVEVLHQLKQVLCVKG